MHAGDDCCRVVVLGSAQDGGVPQAGCRCPNCRTAVALGRGRTSASLAVVMGKPASAIVLVDASPDLRRQLGILGSFLKDVGPDDGRRRPFDAVFLTHLHMGHCAGLLELGREVMDAKELPIYCTRRVGDAIRENAPWQLLVRLGNIVLHTFEPGDCVRPVAGLSVRSLLVPHRDELGDTVGYLITCERSCRSLLYIPDADSWGGISPPLTRLVAQVDYALLDGTFFHGDELSKWTTRRVHDVPHPPIRETVRMLRASQAQVWFTHLNHTNPLLDPRSAESRWLRQAGNFGVADDGMVFDLG